MAAPAVLARYWQIAAAPVPAVVIGGGRWGRVWVSVIAAARGSGKGIALAARTDVANAREWAGQFPGATGIAVVGDLREAMALSPRPRVAIIASRPRDHVRDALEAIGQGLDVLVEKPLSDQAAGGRRLISAARHAGRTLALGTEYMFLPAFHHCAAAFIDRGTDPLTMRLEWDDPLGEVRHGAAKRRHEETGLLVDLLPHAVSIFRLFAPDAAFHILEARESVEGSHGFLKLSDGVGGCFELSCDATSTTRRRSLSVEVAGRSGSIDFTDDTPRIDINGEEEVLEPALKPLQSTLRLELGAFFLQATDESSGLATTNCLSSFLELHEELERILQC